MARWYPNADGKCGGSFLAVKRSRPNVVVDGKVRAQCPECSRFIGLRNAIKNGPWILQQHMRVPAKNAKCQRPACSQTYIRHQGDERRCPNYATNVGANFIGIGQQAPRIMAVVGPAAPALAGIVQSLTGISIDHIIEVAAFGTPADERALFAEVSENIREEQRSKIL